MPLVIEYVFDDCPVDRDTDSHNLTSVSDAVLESSSRKWEVEDGEGDFIFILMGKAQGPELFEKR